MSKLEHFIFFFCLAYSSVSLGQIAGALQKFWRITAIEKGLK